MGHVCVVHYVLCIVCYVLCVVCMSFMLCDYAGPAGMLHHAKSDIVVFFLKKNLFTFTTYYSIYYLGFIPVCSRVLSTHTIGARGGGVHSSLSREQALL